MAAWFLPLLLLVASPDAAPVPIGPGKIEVEVGGRKFDVFTYKPRGYKDGPLIVVFHGMNRNADTYRDNGIGMGDKFVR